MIRKEDDGWIFSRDKRKAYEKNAEIRADL